MEFSDITSIKDLIKTADHPLTKDTIRDLSEVQSFKSKFLTSVDLMSEDEELTKAIAKEFAELVRTLSQQCDMSVPELKHTIKEYIKD